MNTHLLFVLSQENLSKVFNEIVQFNASELQNGGGSGFGLWSKYHSVTSIAEL